MEYRPMSYEEMRNRIDNYFDNHTSEEIYQDLVECGLNDPNTSWTEAGYELVKENSMRYVVLLNVNKDRAVILRRSESGSLTKTGETLDAQEAVYIILKSTGDKSGPVNIEFRFHAEDSISSFDDWVNQTIKLNA
jgi:hypothetical protein